MAVRNVVSELGIDLSDQSATMMMEVMFYCKLLKMQNNTNLQMLSCRLANCSWKI
jgi:hypothetical protein